MVLFKFLTLGLHPFDTMPLIGPSVKWYIELPRGAFALFDDLVMNFLNHFQLPVRYDVGMKFLLTFWQDKATHILDHI